LKEVDVDMMFPFSLFVLSWIFFLIFADKSQLKRFLSTVYFGIIVALMSDLFMHVVELWKFNVESRMQTFIARWLVAWGVYFVVMYFFLQWLPQKQTFRSMVRYLFYWTTFSILAEWLFVEMGWFLHQGWWNLFHSYWSDWVLYIIFYIHFRRTDVSGTEISPKRPL
jgi:hypothetical protein